MCIRDRLCATLLRLPVGLAVGRLVPGTAEDPAAYYAALMLQEILLWGLPALLMRPWRGVAEKNPSAGLCFAALLVNYFLASLSSFFSSTAFASFAALTFAVAALALIFYLMTKSGFASAVIFIASEVLVFVFYTFKKDSFEGLFPNILSSLSLFARFEQFVSGIFDVTAIVFYITVAAVFLFLSVQAMEKRRWS